MFGNALRNRLSLISGEGRDNVGKILKRDSSTSQPYTLTDFQFSFLSLKTRLRERERERERESLVLDLFTELVSYIAKFYV